MFPLSGRLVKFLATVAAFMTVTIGMPRVQCVCPDGRVNFFCPGPRPSECCCASPTPLPTEVNHDCCRTAGEPPCCAHASRVEDTKPACGGQTMAVKGCGCQRTVVTNSLAYTAEGAGEASRVEADTSTVWELITLASEQAVRFDRVEQPFPLPPPDRVIVFCHFTC